MTLPNIPAGWVPTDEQILRFMNELHSNVPEADRPMSMSDFSDEQLARIRRAFAVLNAAPKALADDLSVDQVAPPIQPLPLEAASPRSRATAEPPGFFDIALNTMHPKCHEAAKAFWDYWEANGETHKHGYYESTWGAINRALRMVGTREHDWSGKK